ncbi:MAG: sigma 54-dependent Fis family transcriptional regulator [Myxococcales bacterium]|nr:sigma 54-dependent Fis family transcriptional regulator [Myxococcales bacterium]
MTDSSKDFDVDTVRLNSPFDSAVLRRPRAELTWQSKAGQQSATIEHRMVLGSAPHAEVVVTDNAVSKLHCELEPKLDGLWVRDLGSRNGTYVRDVRIVEARVPDGATLRVGSTVVTVRYAPEPTAVDLWGDVRFGPLVGHSPVMREFFARLARVAKSDATVLIHGETGSGKELVATAVHETSSRASGPLVVVDCGSLPENLLEAELFGHARGAFTGATGAREGAIEAAHGGTVFLDEIGEIPLVLQPKLLRVLESRSVRRLGENHYRKVDVRFVCATHRDLRRMVNAGSFREDLYFRLAVVPVTVPSLRERVEDIPVLAQHFLPEKVPLASVIDGETMQELLARPWPGNVRELRNFVDRAVALGAKEALSLSEDALPRPSTVSSSMPTVKLDVPFKTLRDEWLVYLERAYVLGLLERHGGNVTATAQAAGLTRAYVHRLLRKYDVDR